MAQTRGSDEAEVNDLLISAMQAERQGRMTNMIRCFEKALALAPDHPQALNGLAVHALATGNPAYAHGLLVRATRADPKATALWMNLAKACRELHDVEGERTALLAALAIDQTDFGALLRLAELHQRLGEDADAAMCWQSVLGLAVQLQRRSPELEALLGRARQFVERYQQGFALALDNALAADRSQLARAASRRFGACLDHMLGRRPLYANICEGGIHYPFLPADEFFDGEHFPWFSELEAGTDAIREEAMGLLATDSQGFVPYVVQPPGTPPNKWTALDGSRDWSACYLWKYGVRDDHLCTACPQTSALIERLGLPDVPGRMPTVFFSLLQPRSRLPAHTGVTNTRAIVHLPLVVPEGCGLRVGGETRTWQVGKAFAFDDTIEHEAWNESDEPRLVLILDHWNPHLTPDEQRMLGNLFKAADRSGFRPTASAVV
jgi:aspartyl/asparaginyl beta-hydroxylase (cupin superfamily)